VGCAVLFLGSVSCPGQDTTFDFRVDRFELKGNENPNYVDEFNDLEAWFKQYGTAFAADGFLHLTNPGTELPNGFGVLPGRTLDLSLVGSQRQVFHDQGSFVARSYWEPDELAPGDFNHMSLNTLGGTGMEIAGVAITNMTADGQPNAYTIVQHLIRFAGEVPEPPQLSSVSIEPSAITGQIVFELDFDDASKTLATGFSLDGGATFQRPFSPMSIFEGTVYGYFLLGADPQTGTVRAHPPVPPLCAHETPTGGGEIVGRAAADMVAVEGAIGGFGPPFRHYDPRRDGAEIRILDRSQPQAPIVDLTGTAALRGGRGCGSRDGWRRARSGFVYRNETGALPPSCTPGSAGGLTRVRLRRETIAQSQMPSKKRVAHRDRGLGFEIDLAGTWHPIAGARIATTLVLGDGTGAGADAPCGTIEVGCVGSRAGVTCE
jgi:hypothetical protein